MKTKELSMAIQTFICIIHFVLDNGKVELQRKSLPLSFWWWSDAVGYYFSNKAA